MPKQNTEHVIGNKQVLSESISLLIEVAHFMWTLVYASINSDTVISQGSFSRVKKTVTTMSPNISQWFSVICTIWLRHSICIKNINKCNNKTENPRLFILHP